jgi:hypothetical protein
MLIDYTNLIFIQPNSLSREFCQELIDKFEKDERSLQGAMFNGRIDPSVKLTTDLKISGITGWEKEDSIVNKTLSEALAKYVDYTQNKNGTCAFYGEYGYTDAGYKLQKYSLDPDSEKTGFYDWHTDFKIDSNGVRILVFMWYLNDVAEGGETEFCNGLKIKPSAGTLVIFPAEWYIKHRGNKPISNDKIICNGWIYASLNRK